jgi:hypothetical protein
MGVNSFTLTTLVKFLNSEKVKKSGNKFTISDAQGYIRRGHLPKYLGGSCISLNDSIEGIKLYNIK